MVNGSRCPSARKSGARRNGKQSHPELLRVNKLYRGLLAFEKTIGSGSKLTTRQAESAAEEQLRLWDTSVSERDRYYLEPELYLTYVSIVSSESKFAVFPVWASPG